MNNYEDMSVGELEVELEQLEYEKREWEKNWMVDDPDGEWSEINREIDKVKQLIKKRSSV